MQVFVTGEIDSRISAALSASNDDAMIAVPFWGEGATKSLRILNRTGSTKIICNLESGGCNPKEIDHLIKNAKQQHKLIEIKTDRTLHAKVYITSLRALVGSANASADGLGFGSPTGGWSETMIETNDRKVIESASHWFLKKWDGAQPITDDMLRIAKLRWNNRPKLKNLALTAGQSLFDFISEHPDYNKSQPIDLFVYRSPASPKGKKEAAKLKRINKLNSEWDYYQDASLNSYKPGHWIIDCYLSKNQHTVTMWQVPNHLLVSKFIDEGRPSYVIFVRSLDDVADVEDVGTFRLTLQDRQKIRQGVNKLIQAKYPHTPIGEIDHVMPFHQFVSLYISGH